MSVPRREKDTSVGCCGAAVISKYGTDGLKTSFRLFSGSSAFLLFLNKDRPLYTLVAQTLDEFLENVSATLSPTSQDPQKCLARTVLMSMTGHLLGHC